MFSKIINIFRRFNTDTNKDTQFMHEFWENSKQIKNLYLREAIKRISKPAKNDLVFDPVGFDEWIYLATNDIDKLRMLFFTKYRPKPAITLSMPKESHTFRPVSYILPSDSIIYQAIVDKLINHKKDLFPKQVYSNILDDLKSEYVFKNPIKYWIKMRENLRQQFKKGNNYYFFADVSGYYENIKIIKLFSLLDFHTGKNEVEYKPLLEKIITKWQNADSQGLIQPHNASAILSKIYLIPVDAELSHLGKNYSRYVDEFHIIYNCKRDLSKNIMSLSDKLRDLGLNLNSSKSRILEGKEILDVITEDQDFFEMVAYLENYRMDFEKLIIVRDNKFENFVKDFESDKKVNMKIFRHCIRKYQKDKNPKAIDFCLNIIYLNYSQIVDIVKYLSVFLDDENYSEYILRRINNYLKDEQQNIYQWVQCWLINLFLKTNYSKHIDRTFLKKVFENKNQNPLSRAIALLAFAKHTDAVELIFIKNLYKETESVLFKRAILAASSKLPRSYSKSLFTVEQDDDIDIVVLKEYLLKNDYKIEIRI